MAGVLLCGLLGVLYTLGFILASAGEHKHLPDTANPSPCEVISDSLTPTWICGQSTPALTMVLCSPNHTFSLLIDVPLTACCTSDGTQ